MPAPLGELTSSNHKDTRRHLRNIFRFQILSQVAPILRKDEKDNDC
jgi:hypothetical protein